MPRPARQARAADYLNAIDNRVVGETNDCTVIAVSVACAVSYERAHFALNKAGRKAGKGVPFAVTRAAMLSLGFVAQEIRTADMLARYPAPHSRVLKNVTTHHPDRFNAAWADGNNYLLRTAGHILAVKNGRELRLDARLGQNRDRRLPGFPCLKIFLRTSENLVLFGA